MSVARGWSRWDPVVILAATVLVYANTFGHAFVWDDPDFMDNSS